MILVNIDIVFLVLDSMRVHDFHCQTVVGVKILFFGADMSSSVHVDNKTKEKTSYLLVKTQRIT